jgi:hypothetical protein
MLDNSRVLSLPRACAAVALMGASLAISACGDDSEPQAASVTEAARTTAQQTSNPDLTQFLMRKDEEPGFRPGALPGAQPASRDTITGVDAFVKQLGLTPTDASRLRSEGFISFTAQPIRGGNTAGVSNVALYETAQGAKHSMAEDLKPAVIRAQGPVKKITFFTVPGVPGARGWRATEPHVANVPWVERRCYLTNGNGGPPGSDSYVAALSQAARAIHARTQGKCQ